MSARPGAGVTSDRVAGGGAAPRAGGAEGQRSQRWFKFSLEELQLLHRGCSRTHTKYVLKILLICYILSMTSKMNGVRVVFFVGRCPFSFRAEIQR